METTHRERKKQQTRQAFIACAYELFEQKGYDATTIAEIAEGANCAPRTFFQYFDSKDDLLLVGIDELWDDLAKVLRERPEAATALDTTKKWIISVTEKFLANEYPLLRMLDCELANLKVSTLARAKLCSTDRLTAILTPEIARDLGVGTEATEPKLIATAAAAILDSYHTDLTLAKTDPLEFIVKAFQILGGAEQAAKSV